MSISFNLGLFIFCLITAFGMIAYKMWQFRTGKIVPASYEEADWTDLSIESVRERLLELVKIAVHKCVLGILKVWIVLAFFVRKYDKIIRAKMINFLHKNSNYTKNTDQKPSEFLSNIKDHQDKIMKDVNRESSE